MQAATRNRGRKSNEEEKKRECLTPQATGKDLKKSNKGTILTTFTKKDFGIN